MIDLHEGLRSFFFTPAFTGGLDFFRVFFGLVVVFDSFVLGANAEATFGATGFVPVGAVRGAKRFEFLSFVSGSPILLRGFFALMGLAGAGLSLGFPTQIMSGIIFFCLVSAMGRNPYSHHSGRKLALIWSFLLIFSTHAWALQLMKIQLGIVYFFTFLHKSEHVSWFDGSMVYKVLAGSSCRRTGVAIPSVMTYRCVSSILTWSTMACQLIAPLLLWDERTFLVGAAALWAMHAGIQTFFSLSTFQFYMFVGPLLFLPPWLCDWLRAPHSFF